MSALPSNPLAMPGAKERIAKMLAMGWTDRQMAAAFGVNVHTFRAWKRHYGLTRSSQASTAPPVPGVAVPDERAGSSSNPLAQPGAKERLMAMLEQGMTDAQVAAALDVSPRTLGWWKRRWGLTQPRVMTQKDTRKRLERLVAWGKTNAECAEAFGVSEGSIQMWKCRWGLTTPHLVNEPGVRARLEELLAQGRTSRECAEEFGVSETCIGQWKRSWGLTKPSAVSQPRVRQVFVHEPGLRRHLKALLKQGMTEQECAAVLGVSKASIGQWKRRWRLTKPQVMTLPGVRERVELLVAQGKTDKEIADEVGAMPSAVYHARRRWGLPTTTQQRSA